MNAPGQAAFGNGRLGLWTVAAVAALAATMGVIWRSAQLWGAEAYAAPYRDRLPMWAAGIKPYSPQDLAEAEHDLKRALVIRPHDGGTHETLGALYSMHAMANWDDLPLRLRWLQQAEAQFNASVALRPYLPQPQANLALVGYMQNAPAPTIFAHWKAAMALGPYEKDTRTTLLNVSLALWDQAPTESKTWVNKLKAEHIYSDGMWERWEAYYGIH